MAKDYGYIDYWNPREKTMDLVAAAFAVLNEYADHLPLTARQIFYRLVAEEKIGKTERDYQRLCGHLANARRAGFIDFEHLRDDGEASRCDASWATAEDFLARLKRIPFRFDHMSAQDVYIECYAEAAGMIGQVERVCSRYGDIAARSSGGFNSVTSKWQLARRIADAGRHRAVILHLGDFDPSGVEIFRCLEGDVRAFLEKDSPATDVEFVRVALTEDQVEEYDLPTAPPKKSDGRSRNFGNKTCQLEALRPNDIADLLDEAINDQLDQDTLERTRDEVEPEEREKAEGLFRDT